MQPKIAEARGPRHHADSFSATGAATKNTSEFDKSFASACVNL